MYEPALPQFIELAEEFDVVPVYREVLADMDTPVSALKKLTAAASADESAFLLESVEGGERFSRYSFLGTNPAMIVRGDKGRASRMFRGAASSGYVEEIDSFDDPLTYLEELMAGMRGPLLPGLPAFFGGAVGYLGYDVISYFERVPNTGKDDLELPEFFFMFTDGLVVFDRLAHSMKVVVTTRIPAGERERDKLSAIYEGAVARIDAMVEALRSPLDYQPIKAPSEARPVVISNMEPERFLDIVSTAKEHIAAGDIFQVVLSQRFETDLRGEPFDLYRVLRRVNPSPYMYYLRHADMAIIGSSPEPLVRVEGDQVLTRPIAGTRRRGKDQADDLRLEAELLADNKERAEHIMLVDLGRNDLGRVCVPGSISVDEFMTIERYSHVMHIVSSVIGKLSPDKTAFDVLRSAFPAGTVSGAPKIRAMEIIDNLEGTRRGPYAGAVGYFGYSGSLDTCITIRTIVSKGGRAYVQAGAGIVADSVPEQELQETQNKARALLAAVELAYAGEV